FNRAAMLIGDPATYVTTGITEGGGEDPYLPADLDGSLPPPAGAPNPFVEYPGNGTYKLYRFHVDWGSPVSSTFSLAGSPSAAAFTQLCAATAPDCVPQAGTTAKLDGLGRRLQRLRRGHQPAAALCGPARRRPGEHARPRRGAPLRRHRQPNRYPVRALG